MIVVVADDSQAGLRAVEWAAREAARHSIPLHVLHAVSVAWQATVREDGIAGAAGAIVEGVNPDEPAADAGLQPGDVILSVNQKPVHSAREAKAAVAQAGKAGRKGVLLLVQRQDAQTFVTVPFAAG